MCKARRAGILAGLSRGVMASKSEEKSVPTVIQISTNAGGVEGKGLGRIGRQGAKLLEVSAKRKREQSGSQGEGGGTVWQAAPCSECEVLPSWSRGAPSAPRVGRLWGPWWQEGLRGTRKQEAGGLTLCLNSEPHPEPGGRGRRGARYSLGLVGEAGGPGLLVSVQVTVEHIEAKAAHLR